MNLRFEPITDSNRAAFEALRLLPEQKDFVDSVAECLQEAGTDRRWHPLGILDGDRPVGFAMYGCFHEQGEDRVWLDRFLIDSRNQRKGYGSAALDRLLVRLPREYHTDTVYLSVFDSNRFAARMYQDHGFVFNGELDIGGEKVMVFHTEESDR